MKIYKSLLTALIALSPLTLTGATTYEADLAHSDLTFKIRHLLSNVTGHFEDWKTTFTVDEKTGTLTSLQATVKAAIINTKNKKRDDHLRNEDFFDVKKFPEITFTSETVKIEKGKTAKLPGTMTMHGVTKPVTWEVEYLGTAKDPFGNEKAALTAKIPALNRKDFNLTWNKPLEKAGETLIGDTVAIEVNVEAGTKMDTTAKPSTTTTTEKTKNPNKK